MCLSSLHKCLCGRGTNEIMKLNQSKPLLYYLLELLRLVLWHTSVPPFAIGLSKVYPLVLLNYDCVCFSAIL